MPTATQNTDVALLWKRYKTTGDESVRERLIRHYAWLAKVGAERVNIPQTPMIGQDDLYGYAVIGLIDAIEKFNPEMGRPFEAYASLRIKGAIVDALRCLDWLPRGLRQGESKLREAMARIEVVKGRSATDEELCEELGIKPEELEELFAATNASAVQSLDQIILEIEDLSPKAGFADNFNADPSDAAERSHTRDLLTRAIDDLPENEKMVITLYYFEEMTLKEIGKVMGVTESRTCQLHTKAIMKLQTKLACWLDVLFMAA